MPVTAAPIVAATKQQHDDNNDQDRFHAQNRFHRNPPLACGVRSPRAGKDNGPFRPLFPAKPWKPRPRLQPPYRYFGSHSVMPGHMYMMTMQMITMNM
jgi:hypothetical protein